MFVLPCNTTVPAITLPDTCILPVVVVMLAIVALAPLIVCVIKLPGDPAITLLPVNLRLT